MIKKKLGWWFYISLIIVIVIAVAAYLHYFYQPSVVSPPIESDSLFLKLAIGENGNISSNVKIKNTFQTKQTFSVRVNGLNDILTVDNSDFELEPNEEHNIILHFNAIGKGKGVFLGTLDVSSNGNLKEIPIIFEIQSKNVLFDTNIYLFPQGTDILIGEKLNAEIKLYDLASIGRSNVKVDYAVKDFKDNIILQESENLIVDGKLDYSKAFDLPKGIKVGNYVLITTVEYEDSIGTSTIYFSVTDTKKSNNGTFDNTNIFFLFILLIGFFFITILLLVFYSLFYKDKLLNELENQYQREIKKEKEIVQLKEGKDYGKLKDKHERSLYKKEAEKVKKKRIEVIKYIYKTRVKKYKADKKKIEKYRPIEKKKAKTKLEKQLALWKSEGYNTKELDSKYKLPNVSDIKNKIKKWKKQGYDTSILEK